MDIHFHKIDQQLSANILMRQLYFKTCYPNIFISVYVLNNGYCAIHIFSKLNTLYLFQVFLSCMRCYKSSSIYYRLEALQALLSLHIFLHSFIILYSNEVC